MKKLIALLLILSTLAALAACGSSDTEGSTENTTVSTRPATTEAPTSVTTTTSKPTTTTTGTDKPETSGTTVSTSAETTAPETTTSAKSEPEVKPDPTGSEGLAYKLSESEDGYIVSGIGSCKDTEIVIPSQYNGLPVVAIGREAFVQTKITGITIPEGIREIGAYAFTGCEKLTSITIPSSVAMIGDFAFSSCRSITSFTVASGNSRYHSDGNCLILTETKTLIKGFDNSVIPSDGSVTKIGQVAFAGCEKIKNIVIPDCITEIGDSAFANCYGLTSIAIPNGVTEISWATFIDCWALTRVTIPDSVTEIAREAFDGCSKLTDIYYTGSQAQWKEIRISDSNVPLENAAIHYNYAG